MDMAYCEKALWENQKITIHYRNDASIFYSKVEIKQKLKIFSAEKNSSIFNNEMEKKLKLKIYSDKKIGQIHCIMG